MNRLGVNQNSDAPQKNIALSPFGYWPKAKRTLRWCRFLKPVGKLLLVVNLSFFGVAGCINTDLDKALLKALMDTVIETGFDQTLDPTQIHYFLASVTAEFFKLSAKNNF